MALGPHQVVCERSTLTLDAATIGLRNGNSKGRESPSTAAREDPRP